MDIVAERLARIVEDMDAQTFEQDAGEIVGEIELALRGRIELGAIGGDVFVLAGATRIPSITSRGSCSAKPTFRLTSESNVSFTAGENILARLSPSGTLALGVPIA